MSTSSRQSQNIRYPRVDSLQNGGRTYSESAQPRIRPVSYNDGYTYALRVAFLSHLLQPRAKRKEYVEAPAQKNRASTSINDMMKDFSLVRDAKSTRFPRGFVEELERRLTGVLMGKEKHPEYSDPLIKRTFAVFLNSLTEQHFKKRMKEDRRVEDLILIFFSNATKELQKEMQKEIQRGKPPGDEWVKLMTDRHVALFVRLVLLILKANDWMREKPELVARLQNLETKLLAHDEDLADESGKKQVEVIAPISYEVKDMPLVQVVSRIFGVTNAQAQSDINKNKSTWTDKSALQDLKSYQAHLNLNSNKTLIAEDFDLEESYEAWKRAETPDLSQMMLAIVQANPELAKSTPGASLPQFNAQINGSHPSDSGVPEPARKSSLNSDEGSSYVIDQPVDMSSLNLAENGVDKDANAENVYTFIPPDPRAYYRFVLLQALNYDLNDASLQPSSPSGETPATKLLSQQSSEMLNELCLRWRIPMFSRMVLFLDVIREKFVEQEISLDTLDSAFNFVKAPPLENKRSSMAGPLSVFSDRNRWTIADFTLMQQLLTAVHDALLRELYNAILHSYDSKPSPLMSSVMYVLEHHVRADPGFSESKDELSRFQAQATDSLVQKARDMYSESVDKEIPQESESWEFYHLVQLGKSVLKLAEKIQKRFKRNPEIMGVNPLMVLLECTLPVYSQDAGNMIEQIFDYAHQTGQEIPIDEGFDLYRELVEVRRIHAESLPGVPFAFHVESMLADFVWQWIRRTDEQIIGWVEQAVKQDQFTVRAETKQIPTEDERHSVSVIDIFRSFNQVIDQISQLNWDDDLQYAKFMTALSKSIGAALARYCELIEQMFGKEMDRMTPEQEAALNQTRQEKWMQLAKDAWSNRERIEPFQFFPESFVKLNNIVFAIHQWDKLEHEMNVDALADVVQRNSPPITQKQRKTNNYVFTIKVVEAEDLKACDMNGLSDPYVVLTDEYQKRLSKTRVVYGNLNPRWEDTVDITTQGPLNIIATIWDWDNFGDHDYVGRTSLKLDPSHFGDFLPREYWLDLDTQGRLLIRVSMEGERDDIQFYFGKAFRTLKRSERDMTRKITDKLSAYINHCLSRRALKQLLTRGISISTMSNFLNRSRPTATSTAPTDAEIQGALQPLFTYFNDNFAIMNQTLTSEAMIMVMTRLWKEVLQTIEILLVPPLSDKPSQQRPLNQQELDIVFKWLQSLFDFFHAVDEETGEVGGVPQTVLKSPKYHEIQTLNFFYFDATENLIRTSERMASATASRQQANRNRLSAPPAFGGAAGLMGMPSTRRAKSIMLSRNLGTMRKAKEEKWKEAQADPNDDMILRILRMRPEAARYLRDRSRQKERLAAHAAAEMIVKQSLMAGGGGRMAGTLGRR